MSTVTPVPKRKLPVAKLVIVFVVLAVVGVAILRGVGLTRFKELLEQLIAVIRDMGPWVFFTAMAILPAFGLPMLAFTIPAGEAFRAQLGLGGVIALALTCIAINLAFTYWIARYALRPVLMRLLTRYGYSVPRITPDNALSVLLLVRLTPGPPYAFQGWLLGCGEAPFRLYMIVSWLAVLPYAIAGIILGEGIFKGNFKAVVGGIGLIVVAAIAVQWVRKKYSRREG
jgi:uncharacterized membrane protein YdjX (TVP38/TMEM64 family)